MGPFIPIYGCGAIIMLFVSIPFRENIFATYVMGMIGATVLEYVTGVIMEALFKVRYWDYSDQKWNFQGHICLSSSLAWGGFTVLLTRVVHKPIEQVVVGLPDVAVLIIDLIVGIIVLLDVVMSVKAAMDLRAVLFKLEKAKQEMECLKHRLDVVIAIVNEESEQRKEIWEQWLEEKMQQMSFWTRSSFKRNPSMSSVRFRESVHELKQVANNWRKQYQEKKKNNK